LTLTLPGIKLICEIYIDISNRFGVYIPQERFVAIGKLNAEQSRPIVVLPLNQKRFHWYFELEYVGKYVHGVAGGSSNTTGQSGSVIKDISARGLKGDLVQGRGS
jgi:hypothetical protein